MDKNFSINLCEEIKKILNDPIYTDDLKNAICTHPLFIASLDKAPNIQRVNLITMFFRIFMTGSQPVPASVRLSLNASNDYQPWLDDVRLTILPFLQENKHFFKFGTS